MILRRRYVPQICRSLVTDSPFSFSSPGLRQKEQQAFAVNLLFIYVQRHLQVFYEEMYRITIKITINFSMKSFVTVLACKLINSTTT